MTTLFVQFSDASQAAIVSVFGSPQDSSVFPNQAEIAITDSRYKTYFNAIPPIGQLGLPLPV